MLRFVLWAAVISGAFAPSVAAAVDVGKPAREFTVVTFDRHTISSADLRGRVVVLNYWATWCAPCKAEMLVFEDYVRRHPGTDLRIYAIATEDSVPPSKLQSLASVLSFPLALRLKGRGYGVLGGVPTSYVIDRSGVVRHAASGAFDSKSFAALVGPLLAEPAPDESAH